jgi:glycosyltransferase involved in cell wall biosynthesis
MIPTVGGRRRSRVVIMAANPFEGVRMADRQLAERLTAYHPVLYVEPPVSAAGRRRNGQQPWAAGPRVRTISDRLLVLTPDALPGLSRPAVAPLNARLVAAQVRATLWRRSERARAVIDADVLLSVMGRCGEPVSLYWAQDDYAGLAPIFGIEGDRLERAAAHMVQRADLIVAANPVVAQSVASSGRHAELIPFGCDFGHFSSARTVSPAADVTLDGPMAVFMGHLGERIDTAILDRVAERGTPLLLVGPRHSQADPSLMNRILARPNVQWVGERPFELLPSYLAHAEVGLLPYNHSRFNMGSFPLKTLEYLAAGLPVVATGLPAITWLSTCEISVADDADHFADHVEALVAAGRDEAGDARRCAFALQHTWESRAAEFARLLGLTRPELDCA